MELTVAIASQRIGPMQILARPVPSELPSGQASMGHDAV